MAQVDYFLKIDGIPGESADTKHKDDIEVLSWHWAEKQHGTMAFGGGGGAGKVQMADFSFTMRVNVASPKLLLACATGDHIKSAIFSARKAGGVQQDYLKITFSDVLVSSYETGGGSGGPLPVDSITLNFAKILFDYKKQDAKGQLIPGAQVSYDLKAMAAR